MSVEFKNAKGVEVSLPEGQADVKPSVTRDVHLQPGMPKVVFDTWGVDVTVNHILYDEPEAADLYALEGEVTVGVKRYSIALEPVLWNIVPDGAHVMVALVEKR